MADRNLDMSKPRVSSPAGGSGDDSGIVWVESSSQSGGYSIKHASKPSTKVKGTARLKVDKAEGETDDPGRGK
jgi:hypothetical protein